MRTSNALLIVFILSCVIGCKQRRANSAANVQSQKPEIPLDGPVNCAALKIQEEVATKIPASSNIVAVVQWDPDSAARSPSKEQALASRLHNLGRFRCYVERAAQFGAKVIAAPEMAMVGYPTTEGQSDDYASPGELSPYAEIIPDPGTSLSKIPKEGSEVIAALAQLASERHIAIVAGLAERVGEGPAAKLYNTAVAIGSNGAVLSRHRKANLVNEGGSRESAYVNAGDKDAVSSFQVGDQVDLGLMICADIYGDTAKKIDLPLSYKDSKIPFRGIVVPSYWDKLSDDKRTAERGRRYFGSVCQYMNTPVLVSNFGGGTPDAGVLVPDGRNCNYSSDVACCAEQVWWNQPTPPGKDGVLLIGGIPSR